MEELAEPVRQCVLFVRRKQTAGINSPDDKGHFESLILEIEFHLNLISSYSKGRTQTTASVQSLREIVRQFNTHIQTRKVTLREYTNFTESLYEGLVQLSDHTIEETKIAILSDPLFSGRHPDTTE
ncbi:MAG: hypothetical protein OXH15_02370 [Gammaproteobacteria bacterium]|nr:hypothetical protein [Gammaproteobacteria bacterium]